MRYRFADEQLRLLYTHDQGAAAYPAEVVKAFRKKVRMIEAAVDERDLRTSKSLHFEKLLGKEEVYSIRLNIKWRLLLRFETDQDGKRIVILEVNNHYGD